MLGGEGQASGIEGSLGEKEGVGWGPGALNGLEGVGERDAPGP